ncbi:aldo/keto reductase [Kibdelosporangium phytohabitans]|uniref:Alcohol dehydrogenase n=1 Tax=Kibdelosporangium phytohabitans TaxID=860235 RepID=A0A0N9IG22_9PSEU|nr:aldo/keto reductase [Kibdelosporangium phytohabitans]ALG14267.1 alcohol dehydrogenase [Kibdelosporangium phytohabitans]MBE1466726.1 aryl-alcohol dehydrogenase-like predicted oxidoreductase [Kibdelosporangium phytohabitans]
MSNIPGTDLDVFPLNLGTNIFGYTADKATSFAIMDRYAEAGGNFLDTADSYSAWAPGNAGGESETIIGQWLAERGNRDRVVLATKVGAHPEFKSLSARAVKAAAEASLRRLGTDRIDLYWAHFDEPGIPVEETLGAFTELVEEGKVRYIGASNLSGERITQSLAASDRDGLARYVALQPEYNLVERDQYESEYAPIAAKENLAVFPYYGLARGFLTGKYRGRDGDGGGSVRARSASNYYDERGKRVLSRLDEIAAVHDVPVGSVALAWLRQQPTVTAPIASARTPEQLPALLRSVTLELTADELDGLTQASS